MNALLIDAVFFDRSDGDDQEGMESLSLILKRDLRELTGLRRVRASDVKIHIVDSSDSLLPFSHCRDLP